MTKINQIENIRDWTNKSPFRNSLIDLMGTSFVYEERDKIDDILIQHYPRFQNKNFPIKDSKNVELFRQLVFIEGIDFLFRAINFSQAIQHLLSNGFYSPAQSMSYQASFFCARSILGLSGIYCSEIKSKNFILDTYHIQNETLNEYEIGAISRDHRTMWELLEKIMQVTAIDDSIIEASVFNIIKNVKYTRCSDLRHKIHYYNKYDFEDIFDRKEYNASSIDTVRIGTINNNCDYFDLLCLFLIFASNLFLSIAVYAQGLDDMILKYKKLLNKEDNKLLVQRQIFEQIKLYNLI